MARCASSASAVQSCTDSRHQAGKVGQSEGLSRAELEVKLLKAVSHPHLLPLLGYCLSPDGICLLSPLMRGGSLEARLRISDPDRAAQLPGGWAWRRRTATPLASPSLLVCLTNRTEVQLTDRCEEEFDELWTNIDASQIADAAAGWTELSARAVRGMRTSGDAQARIQGNMLLAFNTLMPRLDRVYASRSAAAPDGFEERIGVVGRPLIGYRKRLMDNADDEGHTPQQERSDRAAKHRKHSMILYRKGASLRVLVRFSGSVLPSAALVATYSAVVAVLLQIYVPEKSLDKIFDDPYPFQPVAHIVGVAIVFATNVAYLRYWESCSSVTYMSARWGDAVATALSFDELRRGGEPADPVERRAAWRERRLSQASILHLASLLHGLALLYLRRDSQGDVASLMHADSADYPDADAAKIEDIPFPWPYAQVIAFLLCVFASVHVARWSLADGADADRMTQLLQSWAFLPAAVAFFSVLAHTGMWNTARILEDPL
ncbi:hypothetical protein EMIHUDRAFT_121623, partial [Emiliania huxleyi CCMP1516]|uniref:Protein kinase domain-containing protein n=2 Tax=Emiliania huxleyi TaxID=2903 RepID=A0A0D3HZL4_EMIH1